jgi:transposase
VVPETIHTSFGLVFDVSKNNVNILPLRTHSEETFRGHIMLSFISVVVYLSLNRCFKEHKVFAVQNALTEMRNLKCKVYEKSLLVKEPTKDMKEICKLSGVSIPEKLKLSEVTSIM